MKNISMILISLIMIAGITSCIKEKGCTDPNSIAYDEDAQRDDGSCEYGGLGGNLTVVAFLKHHSTPIINRDEYLDTVFVKFNTKSQPGKNPSDYDAFFVGDAGEDHVHLMGLKRGNYYLFAVGFDTAITQRVTGGTPFSTTQMSGEIDFNIAVTE